MSSGYYEVLCYNCGEHIYYIDEDYLEDGINCVAEMFLPAYEDIPQPEPQGIMICPLCNDYFVLKSCLGFIKVLTNEGVKP